MTDLLTPLIDAYREENPPSSIDARALRSRILQASARRRQSPARHLKWLVPIAATFGGTAALAATPVARPFVQHLWTHLTALVPSGTAPHTTGARRAPLPAPPALTLAPSPDLPRPSLPPASPDASVTSLAPPPASGSLAAPLAAGSPRVARVHAPPLAADAPVAAHTSPAPAAPAPVAVTSVAPPPPVPPPAPRLDPDLSAYQVAHRLHFTSGDYTRALLAWNGYLSRFPNGTFAPEARLNRAVCLARLGRAEEARSLLQAIARGRGGYAAQAQQLLQALGTRE